jgi:hypothetical protein
LVDDGRGDGAAERAQDVVVLGVGVEHR